MNGLILYRTPMRRNHQAIHFAPKLGREGITKYFLTYE